MENDKSLKNKRIFKGILVAALALCSVYSWTLPISSEFCKVSWIIKALTGGSILCGLAFYIIVIALSVKNGKENKKYYYDILYASPLLVLETLNILAIFDYEIWEHKSTLAGLALFLTMFVEFFASIRVLFRKSFGHENVPVFLLSIAAMSGLITFLSIYSGNVEYTDFFAKAGVGLIYLVGIALYIHQFIYKPKKPEKIISNIIFIVLLGAIITLCFPYYIQWCGLTGENFDTFVSVYAAVIGGALTLAGVAWTIKDTNDKRKEDLQRIEVERKEEERKKNIPYLMLANGSVTPNIARITETNNLNFSKPTDVLKIKDGTYFVIKIDPFNVKNVSQSNAILKGIFLDEVYHKFAHDVLIKKDGLCQVQVGINHWFAFPRKITSVRLLITDTLFNEYTIECEMYKKQDDKPQKDIAPNGIEYTICSYNYVAETILLPEYKTEEEFDE